MREIMCWQAARTEGMVIERRHFRNQGVDGANPYL
jgi:hypothetical protein